MIRPVILCGGKGSRLWPLSREHSPKQYISLDGRETLFQKTVLRARNAGAELPPLAVCNAEHRFFVAEQLQLLNIAGEIILEPLGRDTAPAAAIAALLSGEEDPLLLVLPADHIVDDTDLFAETVKRAVPLAEEGRLVTFGVTPRHPETGFGYIQRGDTLGTGFEVRRFVEKPDQATAEEYLASGDYLWNSGMFLFRASAFLAELERFAPAMLQACRIAADARTTDLDFIRLTPESFGACPADSIDYAVMEKTDRCAVVPFEAGWNDLGSWTALYESGRKDEEGNVVRGDIVAQGSSNCYLHAETRLLAAVGLDNIIAVETADAVLVAHRDNAQAVKQVFTELHRAGRSEAEHHRKVYRPWGAYESTDRDNRFQVKRITVKPGQKLSLQMHHHRAEHWVVVRGTAKVVNGDREIILTEDQSTYIPVGNLHRLENPGRIPLELIEIQTGPYLGEDDIVRFADDYGRQEG